MRLGQTPLIERHDQRFAVRERGEIERLLKRAYGTDAAVDRLMSGLATVAHALNANDQCLARIAAVHLRIPDLPDHNARSEMEAEDILIKSVDWNPDLHPRAGTPPNPGWFAPTGGDSEGLSATRITQNDDPAQRSDTSPNGSDDRVRLSPGERNDELGDLLEWIANAKPEDEKTIRAEIKRNYYDVGDELGYEALNAALSDILQPGIDKDTRQEILNGIEPYAHTESARGQSGELLTAATLLLLGMVPLGTGIETALAAWDLGWAARGLYFSEQLGANLPPTFGVIDKFLDGVATSIKSIDLRSATYQDTVRLAYRLNDYIDKLALFDGDEMADILIRPSNISRRILSVAVPKGSMTPVQRAAIEAAKSRAQAFDVELIVTPF